MPRAVIDGIETRYEIVGSGPPLLMYAPGGFNAVVESWSTLGIYAMIKLLDQLPRSFTCILFDRRECGQSGGRVEPVTWAHYVAQGKGLLDHLNISRASYRWLHGLFAGRGVRRRASAHGREHDPVLAGRGAKYRIANHRRFAEHLAFMQGEGLDAVVAVAASEGKPFGADPRSGPWASVIKRDPGFAAAFAKQDPHEYRRICEGTRDALFDRDTAPGAAPEALMRLDIPALIVPGHDDAHTTSAARYLEECLPGSQYWNVPVEQQTEAETGARVMEFLAKIVA